MDRIPLLLKAGLPLATVLFGGAYLLGKCIYTVEGGHRAVKFSRISGMLPNAYREGWHLMIPYFERPIIYDVRTHPKVLNSKTGSKDLQTVDITVRVLYRPMPDKLTDLYRFVGKDYDERVLPSIVNEVVKTVVVFMGTLTNRHNTTLPSCSASENRSVFQSVNLSRNEQKTFSSLWTMSPL